MSHPMQNPYPPPPHNAAPPGPPPPQQAPYPPMPPQGQYVQYSPQQPPTHPHPHQQPGPPPGPPQPQYYAQPMQPQPHQSPYGVSQPPHMYPPPHHQTHWVPHPHAHPQQHMMQPHHPQQQMAPHQMPPNYPPHNQPPPPGPHYQMPPSQYVPHPQYAQTHHPQAPHPHYYPPQPMPPQPPHPSPYGVNQPPQMYPPHPQPHWGQHAPPPPHTAPHPPPPHPHAPHPHPQQQMMHHPQQQMPHPPQPSPYYHQPPHQPQPQPPHPHMVQSAQQPPPPSPNHYHHHPSRNHTPQQTPPPNHTPVKVVPQCPTPVTPTSVPKAEKKDIITFPKNCVEATKPVAIKKRKFTSKDVTDIEVWRLLMCLKSGLLAESSWAIDVLSILLNDDSTIMHFGLQHTPGLLEAVLEHFKCCLNDIYDGIVSDTMLKSMISESKPSEMSPVKKENEVTTTTSSKPNNHNNNNNNVSNNNNIIEVKNVNNNNNINGIKDDSIVSKVVINKKKINDVVDEISPKIPIPNLNDQIVMFTSKKNYTFKTRDGKIVKLKNGEAPVQDDPTYELTFKPVGYSHWQEGNGEDTSHILGFFQPKNFMELSRRCTCLSTILRNLSFIPGNDVEMSRHAGLLLVLGRLLLLKHDDDVVHNEADSAPSEWSLLSSLREDTLVIISNISSSLDLSPYNDKINLSLLDGLLHWACCNSSYALDPFPPPSVTVTPQRLALESLAKLSIIEGNVDLLLATPPWSRIEQLFEVLARLLSTNEDQTIREFSLVLLSNLTAADSGIARKVALTGTAIPRLISFLEMSLADPETYSTTQDMLRRAALTLKCLSQLVDNHPLFAQYQPRLLNLVMSQKLDMEVVPIIADVIFEISLSD